MQIALTNNNIMMDSFRFSVCLGLVVLSVLSVMSPSQLFCRAYPTLLLSSRRPLARSSIVRRLSSSSADSTTPSSALNKGKLLVLGGTGFLGQNICKRAVVEGYQVTSLSRRGLPPPESANTLTESKIEYRKGDARKKESIENILEEGDYTGMIHCIGLLFDTESGLGDYNRFVSGSGSLPDGDSTYDSITRITAFHAIDAATEYAQRKGIEGFPLCFTSAAEAGWPEVTGGDFMDRIAPDFLKRYLAAKRTVEAKLLAAEPTLRPIIVRPSLIYSMDRPASYLPVGAFFLANKIGLPFVDRPVTVQSLAAAMVRSMNPDSSVKGVLRYPQIDELNE